MLSVYPPGVAPRVVELVVLPLLLLGVLLGVGVWPGTQVHGLQSGQGGSTVIFSTPNVDVVVGWTGSEKPVFQPHVQRELVLLLLPVGLGLSDGCKWVLVGRGSPVWEWPGVLGSRLHLASLSGQ